MIARIAFVLSSVILVVCAQSSFSQKRTVSTLSVIYQQGSTIEERFRLYTWFNRTATNDYGRYLRALPLKKHGAKVHLYNGALKARQDVHAAVINMDVGKRDLQQCADAVMRLRAEYLYQQKQYDKIHFKFTNGFDANFGNGKMATTLL